MFLPWWYDVKTVQRNIWVVLMSPLLRFQYACATFKHSNALVVQTFWNILRRENLSFSERVFFHSEFVLGKPYFSIYTFFHIMFLLSAHTSENYNRFTSHIKITEMQLNVSEHRVSTNIIFCWTLVQSIKKLSTRITEMTIKRESLNAVGKTHCSHLEAHCPSQLNSRAPCDQSY